MKSAIVEIFDFTRLAQGCVAGYEVSWPEVQFELEGISEPFSMTGIPEAIAQLLDKLVANAVSFQTAGTPIKIALEAAVTAHDASRITLVVINEGPKLAAAQPNTLFDPMVSTRSGEGQHLALGLYIARMIAEFNDGKVTLRDHRTGVAAAVELPGGRLTSRLLR